LTEWDAAIFEENSLNSCVSVRARSRTCADEDQLFKHRFLNTEHEIHQAFIRAVCPSYRSRDRVFDNRSARLVKFKHDDLPLYFDNGTALFGNSH
jgi:hypothetical protein